jgi:ABC-type glycerol-3-phosphate transport system substrate-binding protein
MIEIKLSYIYNFEQDERLLAELLDEFGAQHGIKVQLQRMTWATAWADLFTIASNGAGADVSHIGSTWVSSLAKMNALRAFKPAEVAEISAPMTFMEPARQSTRLFEDERVWSVPWTYLPGLLPQRFVKKSWNRCIEGLWYNTGFQ